MNGWGTYRGKQKSRHWEWIGEGGEDSRRPGTMGWITMKVQKLTSPNVTLQVCLDVQHFCCTEMKDFVYRHTFNLFIVECNVTKEVHFPKPLALQQFHNCPYFVVLECNPIICIDARVICGTCRQGATYSQFEHNITLRWKVQMVFCYSYLHWSSHWLLLYLLGLTAL